MCGRFVQAAPPDTYAAFFGVDAIKTEALAPSYNVAPTDPVYAIATHDGERQLGAFRWGLLPFWAKDRKMAARNINARVETVATKNTFKESLVKRRCVVPADGFYEWQKLEDGKLPHFIYGADGSPTAFAGLWSSWRDPETSERVVTCTILTGRPNELIAPVHDRMPVMLDRNGWERWLDPELTDPDEILQATRVRPSEEMAYHPVSTLVNKVANNVPELIDELTTPVAEQSSLGFG